MSQSRRRTDKPHRAFVGKYVIDSLSFGMYDHPLMALREYVQNSTDAIDEFAGYRGNNTNRQEFIEITVDGRNRSLRIIDNGTGVAARKAWSVLHDLGRSEKDPLKSRGFRGIGRLGGLGYCTELSFSTKAAGEELVSSSTWDCEELRQLVSGNGSALDVASIIDRVATFRQEEYHGSANDHFFMVEMNDVRSSKDVLLDVPAIKAYLAQVAPVPFHPTDFHFGREIDKRLRENVPTYETYCIRVNGDDIRKPYTNSVRTGDDAWEEVKAVSFFELSNDDGRLALGWLGELALVGRVSPSSLVDGLRVRSGNIQIGSKDILAEFYREKRFSNYMIGEIHVVDSRLVPNSRRDDFEDGPLRDDFLVCFIREIGIPFSRKIRELSQERSKARKLGDVNMFCERANRVLECGYFAESQKQEIVMKLLEVSYSEQHGLTKDTIEDLVQGIAASRHVLDNGSRVRFGDTTDALKSIFETIYNGMNSKIEAETLIEKILREIQSNPNT